jgi:hypothetical protein
MEVAVTRTLLILLACAVATGVTGFAHHSFSAYYFEDQSVTIAGELEEFEFKNPHAWVHVMVADSNGQAQRYGAEWAGAGRLRQQGIDQNTLKPGDRVVITGSPGRVANEFRIHLKGIERPADGWSWRGGRNRRR